MGEELQALNENIQSMRQDAEHYGAAPYRALVRRWLHLANHITHVARPACSRFATPDAGVVHHPLRPVALI